MDESSVDGWASESQNMDVLSVKTAGRPGEIDNSDILLKEDDFDGDELELRRMLEEGRDYVLVPQQVWEKLLDWYFHFPFFFPLFFQFSLFLPSMLLGACSYFSLKVVYSMLFFFFFFDIF